MRITKLLKLMIVTIVVACPCSSVLATNSEDGDIIPIIQIPSSSPGDDGRPRSTADFFYVYYDTNLASVFACISNVGTNVLVKITNATTCESYDYDIPGFGSSILPISGNAGYWTITFTLSDGTVYGGHFVL